MKQPEWLSPEGDALLRQLWAEGHSAAEIGRRVGASKNAVVGKAHRLGLPSRASPIGAKARTPEQERTLRDLARRGMGQKAIARAMHLGTDTVRSWAREIGVGFLARAGCPVRIRAARPVAVRVAPVARVREAPAEVRVAVAAPAPKPVIATVPVGAGRCCWPMWSNGARPSHVYCDAPTADHRWCDTHCARGYDRRPARQLDAA